MFIFDSNFTSQEDVHFHQINRFRMAIIFLKKILDGLSSQSIQMKVLQAECQRFDMRHIYYETDIGNNWVQTVIDIIMEIALSPCENNDIGICSRRRLSDLECADDVVLLNKDPNKVRVLIQLSERELSYFWDALYTLGA